MSKTNNASFSSLGLPPDLVKVAEDLGYQKLTPIQALAIPQLLAGRDVVGQAKTGSGKTLAFVVPILASIRPGDLKRRGMTPLPPQAVILCPTRELSSQVAREIRKLGRYLPGLSVQILAGGQPVRPQALALQRGVPIVVGTPGRMVDLLRRGFLDLSRVGWLVLDEADRMLDMGFQEDMEFIIGAANKKRQTVLFSATFPTTIQTISKTLQNNPLMLQAEPERESESGSERGGATPGTSSPAIRQILWKTEPSSKQDTLLKILRHCRTPSALVFCNQKTTTAELAEFLVDHGFQADCLHGDLEQIDRDRVMAKFRNGSLNVLVATDVAARGIDISDLALVCNFDLPSKPETYVHRIGRTGRAGKKGVALSLASPRDSHKVESIETHLGLTLERTTSLDLNTDTEGRTDAEAGERPIQAPMNTLYIGGGRRAKMRPGDILGALTGETCGLKAADVGKIEIHDHFAYVAVAQSVVEKTLMKLQNGQIKGKKFQVELVR